MASATVLLAFIAIGLLDSLHYRVALEGKAEQKTQYAVEVLSLLDALAAPLRTRNEKTYSEPFATRLYAKESIDVPGQGTVRDYPRLKHGGQHLGEREDEVAADAGFTALRMAALAFARLVRHRWHWRRRRSGAALPRSTCPGWQKIRRGETAFAWDAVLGTLLVMLLVAVPLFALAGHYHVFGTDKVGQDVLYQVLKSVRTGADHRPRDDAGHAAGGHPARHRCRLFPRLG